MTTHTGAVIASAGENATWIRMRSLRYSGGHDLLQTSEPRDRCLMLRVRSRNLP